MISKDTHTHTKDELLTILKFIKNLFADHGNDNDVG